MTSSSSSDASIQHVHELLEQAISPIQKPKVLKAYRERLRTFSPSLYFAKPASISPVICAARGWSCKGLDLLECSHCHALLAISYSNDLTVEQHRQVTYRFQEQLAATGHINDMCLFYSRDFLSDDPLPLYLISALGDDDLLVQLMEHPHPASMLVEKSQGLTEASLNDEPLSDEDKQLIQAACPSLTATRVLMGWMNDDTCTVCLGQLQGDRLLSSHKYYCPYRSCWKLIAQKIVGQQNHSDDCCTPQDTLARLQGLWKQLEG